MSNDSSDAFNGEAQSQTVTRDGLKEAEQNRPVPNVSLDYTIGGTAETSVHSNVEAERIYQLNSGYRTLYEASDNMQHDYAVSSTQGVTRAEFQAQAADRSQSSATTPEQDNAPQQQSAQPEFQQTAEPQKHSSYAQQQREIAAQAPSRSRQRSR